MTEPDLPLLAGGDVPGIGADAATRSRRGRVQGVQRPLSMVVVGVAGLAIGLGVALIVLDLIPGIPDSLHTIVSGLPLLLVALAYLGHQGRLRNRPRVELTQAGLLALAFLLWSAYQLFPNVAHAAVLNDAAIVLFTADLGAALVAYRRPAS